MTSHATDTLFAYWDSLRGQRIAPDRTEIEPRAIASILGDTFVLETDPTGSIRYRLAGSRICSAFGQEMKGQPFMTAFSDADRASLIKGLADAHAACTGLRVTLTGTSAAGRKAEFDTVILPLAHRGRIGQRMIGALTGRQDHFWTSHDAIQALAVSDLRLTWPTWQAAAVGQNQPAMAQGPAVNAGRPQLRLIQGGNAA
ncbi:PAS domain-containing protein [Phreatobacter aquaticus]|nr:PAS domain-containing protein [Phreatobacter aquaticus]